ncbi:Response regulator mcs4 [Schizosaccharomyces pombe]
MRIWFKKVPDGITSSVILSEDHLVDDLKDAIARKFPIRISQYYDAPELSIRVVAPPNASSELQSRELSPNESILFVMETYYPHGQDFNDALLVASPDTSAALRYRSSQLSSSTFESTPPVFSEYPPNIIPTPANETVPRIKQPSIALDSLESPVSAPSRHQSTYSYKGGPLNYNLRNASRTRSHQTLPSSNVNKTGVLLLPRSSRQQTLASRPSLPDLTSADKSQPSDEAESITRKNSVGMSTRSDDSTAEKLAKAEVATPTNSRSISHSSLYTKQSGTAGVLPAVNADIDAANRMNPDISSQFPIADNKDPLNADTQAHLGFPSNQIDGIVGTSPVNVLTSPGIGAKAPFASLLEGVIPPINVLIVEDNIINQKILETFMKKRNISSEVAKDGLEALEKWKKKSFHLILMDIQLPTMSGIEVTQEIRRLERLNAIGVGAPKLTQPIPEKDQLNENKFQSPVIIVALTASSLMADRNEALAAGCNDFLTKPVSLVWLEKKITEWGCMQALIDWNGWCRFRGR